MGHDKGWVAFGKQGYADTMGVHEIVAPALIGGCVSFFVFHTLLPFWSRAAVA